LVAIAAILAAGSAGIWFLNSDRQAAQDRDREFFGTSKEFPTSGGQKMKPEW
jgi:Ti type entry exclusion protein TrbK